MENNNLLTTNKDKWKVVAIIFIIAFVLSTGVAIFFIVKNNSKQSQLSSGNSAYDDTDDKPTYNDDVTEVDTPNISDNAQVNDAKGYFVIREWGIKIKMRDADKISASLFFPEKPVQFMDFGAYYDSSIGYTINDGVLHDERCSQNGGQEGLGGAILRLVNTGGLTDYRVVGDYAYARAAAPGVPCPYNTEDAALQTRIFEDFVPANIEQIVPFVKK